MASKVNVKFVALLAAGVIVVAGGLALIYAKAATKSAADHAKAGDEFVAKGEYEKAASSYSKAVSKSKVKPEYVHKWIGALEKIVPATAQAFNDRFSAEYIPAMRGLAEVQPGVAEAQKPILDMLHFQYRLFPPAASQWEAYIEQVESILRGFTDQESDDARILRYYRGMSRTIWVSMVNNATDDHLTKAKDDLEATLKVKPSDAKAMASLGDWYRVKAQRSRERRDLDDAEKMTAEGRRRLAAFVEAHPKANLPVLWTLTQMEIMEASRVRDSRQAAGDFYVAQQPKVQRLIEQVMAEPPEGLDALLVFQVCAMTTGAGMPDAMKRVDEMLAHVGKAMPDNVLLAFKRGELEISAREYERAIQTYEKFVSRSNLPVGMDGMLLFIFREESLARQADASLAMWESAKDDAERTKRLTDARTYRDRLREQYGKSPRLLLLDAKIKFCERDLIETRKLLSAYTDQNPNDAQALRLLADVLLSQQQYGAAKLKLEQALNLNQTDVVTMIKLGEVNEQLQDFPEALKYYRELAGMLPENEKLREKIKSVEDLAKGGQSDDPVIRTLNLAQEKVTASPPDSAGALAMLRELATSQEKLGKLNGRTAAAIARALLILEDRETAAKVLDIAIKAEPTNKECAFLRRLVDAKDPVEVQAQMIDEQPGIAPLAKHLLRYQLFRRNNQMTPARAELDKAKAIDPENGLYISAMFDEKMAELAAAKPEDAARLKAEIRVLAEKATEKNIDRVNGKIFMIRIEQMEGRLPQAAAMAQQIIDQDPLNPIGHRLLGVIRLQQGQFNEALTAFEKAIQCKPDDVENIKGKCRALIGLKRLNDALLFARESKNFAGGDADYADILLALEGEIGNVEFAIDRRMIQFRRNADDRQSGLELAALLIKAKRWAEARTVLDTLLAKSVDYPAMQLDAQWLATQGDIQGAKTRWDTFIAGLPAGGMNLGYVASYREFLVACGDYAGAKEVLLKYRTLQTAEGCEIDRELGDLAFQQRDYKGAVTHYTEAMKCKDEGNRLRYRVIEAHLNDKNLEAAQRLLEKAGQDGIRDDQQLLLLKAEVAVGMKDKAAARRHLDAAISQQPNSPIGFYKRAEFFTSLMEGTPRATGPDDPVLQPLRDAATDLESALKFEARMTMARRLLARVRAALGSADQATKILQDGLALNPDDGAIRGDIIELLSNQGNSAGALAQIEEAIKRSEDPRWKMMGGDLLRKQGEIDKAADYYAKAWATVQTPPLARAYCDTIMAQAKPDLTKIKAVLAHPGAETEKWPTLLTMRAKVAAREGRAAEMQADMRTAFGMLATENAAAAGAFFQDAGEMYAGKLPELMKFLDSVKPAAGFTDPFRAQIIRFKLMEPTLEQDGLKDLDQLIAVNTNQAAVLSAIGLLGDLMYGTKKYPLAVEVWTRYLRMNPDEPEKLNNLAYALSRQMGKHDEALKHATRACEIMPSNPNFLDTLGVIQLALARVADAEATFKKALGAAGLPSQQVPIFIHLAEVELAKGNRQGASRSLNDAERMMNTDARIKAQFQQEYTDVRRKLDQGR